MDIHQLRTFVVVAREGSVTRASEILHLSQPAVSAHVKTMEETLGVTLFERTPRGMSLTSDGRRLLSKAELTLAAHRELMDEASRGRSELTGRLRVGAGTNSDDEAVGRLLTALSERCPRVEVALKHGTSREILAGIRNGSLDAGFYNDPGKPDADLITVEVSRFGIQVVAAPGLVAAPDRSDWKRLADFAWVYPASSVCCGLTAEALFERKQFRPARVVSVDRQDVTRTLIASGMGLGLLHSDQAREAESQGEIEILFDTGAAVGVFFASLARRKDDPVLSTAASILETTASRRAARRA